MNFFATRKDLLSVTSAIEAQREIKYICKGALNGSRPMVFESAKRIPNLGIAKYGDHLRESMFVVLDRRQEFVARKIILHAGGYRYAVDQQENPSSVTLQTGGAYGDEALISGNVATCSNGFIARVSSNADCGLILQGATQLDGKIRTIRARVRNAGAAVAMNQQMPE